MRRLLAAAFAIAVASCGTGTKATHETNGGTAMDATLTKLSLTSDAFANGQ